MSRDYIKLEPEYLHSRFLYVDGALLWKRKNSEEDKNGWNTRFAGKEAGGPNSEGYWKIKLDGQWIKRHRIVWAMHYGDAGCIQIDHINGDRANDQIGNLRKATAQQNAFNRKKQPNCRVGVKGVVRARKKFHAYVVVGKISISGGYFDSLEEAKNAVRNLRVKLHGNFANHGESA